MERPENLKTYPARDLKLSIKSSFPNPKSAIGFFILLWEIMDKPSSLVYANENNSDKLILKPEILEKIKNFTGIGENEFLNCIANNNLLQSQLESLIVAFELIWCLGKIEFENGMSATAERTGGKRYSKKIFFTTNMDLIDLSFSDCKDDFHKVLLNWMGIKTISVNTNVESRLVKILTVISERAVYKLKDGEKDVVFNSLSIYSKVLKDLNIDLKGDEEARGSLRILHSELKDELNSYLAYDGNQVSGKSNKKNELISYSERVDTYLLLTNEKTITAKQQIISSNSSLLQFPHNRIIFGAPGTGKSYALNKFVNPTANEYAFDKDHFERVTFHPNYSYAQFVGTYKPVKKESKDLSSLTDEQREIYQILIDKSKNAEEKYNAIFEKRDPIGLTRIPILLALYSDDDSKYVLKKEDGTPAVQSDVEKNHGKKIRPFVKLLSETESSDISYEYTPGPFIRVLEKALKNPTENYLLLIEEINRANVAAAFGDVFQLLDRDSDGNSEYEIDASNDLDKYLNDEGITLENHKLKIPSNMYIWATMNSADQGVMPLDAAFKRRWNFEYLNIDANENGVKNIDIPNIKKDDGSYNLIKWNLFRKALNNKLKIEPSLNVNEDKLLGPFFISLKDLQNAKTEPEKFIDLFKSKVLMYLFEDVCKMNPKALFAGIGIDGRIHYSDVCKQFDEKGVGIFSLTEADLSKFDK